MILDPEINPVSNLPYSIQGNTNESLNSSFGGSIFGDILGDVFGRLSERYPDTHSSGGGVVIRAGGNQATAAYPTWLPYVAGGVLLYLLLKK